MTTPRQTAANRRNAARSTGPKSAAGKARSSQNALRHGLSARLGAGADPDPRVEGLAREIAGEGACLAELTEARVIADATLKLTRIGRLRADLTPPGVRQREVLAVTAPKNPKYRRRFVNGEVFSAAHHKLVDKIVTQAGVDRGDIRAFAERWWDIAAPVERTPPPPSGVAGEFALLDCLLIQMGKLNRYERRETSRRKTAIRRLEELRSARLEHSKTAQE